jgi:hypothetical protein
MTEKMLLVLGAEMMSGRRGSLGRNAPQTSARPLHWLETPDVLRLGTCGTKAAPHRGFTAWMTYDGDDDDNNKTESPIWQEMILLSLFQCNANVSKESSSPLLKMHSLNVDSPTDFTTPTCRPLTISTFCIADTVV